MMSSTSEPDLRASAPPLQPLAIEWNAIKPQVSAQEKQAVRVHNAVTKALYFLATASALVTIGVGIYFTATPVVVIATFSALALLTIALAVAAITRQRLTPWKELRQQAGADLETHPEYSCASIKAKYQDLLNKGVLNNDDLNNHLYNQIIHLDYTTFIQRHSHAILEGDFLSQSNRAILRTKYINMVQESNRGLLATVNSRDSKLFNVTIHEIGPLIVEREALAAPNYETFIQRNGQSGIDFLQQLRRHDLLNTLAASFLRLPYCKMREPANKHSCAAMLVTTAMIRATLEKRWESLSLMQILQNDFADFQAALQDGLFQPTDWKAKALQDTQNLATFATIDQLLLISQYGLTPSPLLIPVAQALQEHAREQKQLAALLNAIQIDYADKQGRLNTKLVQQKQDTIAEAALEGQRKLVALLHTPLESSNLTLRSALTAFQSAQSERDRLHQQRVALGIEIPMKVKELAGLRRALSATNKQQLAHALSISQERLRRIETLTLSQPLNQETTGVLSALSVVISEGSKGIDPQLAQVSAEHKASLDNLHHYNSLPEKIRVFEQDLTAKIELLNELGRGFETQNEACNAYGASYLRARMLQESALATYERAKFALDAQQDALQKRLASLERDYTTAQSVLSAEEHAAKLEAQRVFSEKLQEIMDAFHQSNTCGKNSNTSAS